MQESKHDAAATVEKRINTKDVGVVFNHFKNCFVRNIRICA